MRHLRCGEEVLDIAVEPRDGGGEVRVGDRSFVVRLTAAGAGVFVARIGTRQVTFHVARDRRDLFMFWDGVAYHLTEEREGASPARRPEGGALEAPMPGCVAAVRVAPGQRVARGDELLVIEAMKMENALRAPRDAVVRAVHVVPGDMVAPGRALVELE
jgi:acetyl-CoA/propionyl-CoA carboxylase biotin carboxyl carrier protein